MQGPRAEPAHRAALHSQACPLGKVVGEAPGKAPGSGGRFDGLQSGCVSAPEAGRDYTEGLSALAPTWPPSWALCLPTLAPGHLPGLGVGVVVGEGYLPFTWQPTLPRLAQHMWTCDTERERRLKEERGARLSCSEQKSGSFIHFYSSHYLGTLGAAFHTHCHLILTTALQQWNG